MQAMRNGYKLIWVGRKHRLGGTDGVTYKHRVLAEKKLGRKLHHDEVIHHKDNNRINNDEENLEIFRSTSDHTAFHRGVEMIQVNGVLQRANPLPKLSTICECGNSMSYGSQRCYLCNAFERRTVKRPSKEQFLVLLESNSLSAIGRIFGVSHTTIRRWRNSYEL